MAKTIRIEDDVYEALQRLAKPFDDTPNSVIKRVLEPLGVLQELDVAFVEARAVTKEGPKRIGRGQLTPSRVFDAWLLHILWKQFGGKAAKTDATAAVMKALEEHGLLREADYEKVSTGETKAENAIAWGRNRLKDAGLLEKNSQWGTWVLSKAGEEKAREEDPLTVK
jgi:predicted transcriptional regulator